MALMTGRLVVVTLAGLALVSTVIIVSRYLQVISTPINGTDQPWVIEPGESLFDFSVELEEQGVIPDGLTLQLLAAIRGDSRRIKAGEYRITKGTTLSELLDQLVQGDVIQRRVTIPEGWTIRDLFKTLKTTPEIRWNSSLKPESLLQQLGQPSAPAEGWFFPDTYLYTRNRNALDLLKQGYQRMIKELDQAWERKTPESHLLKNPYEALILASIIEKEAGRDDERNLISAVFHNRLDKKMRLQSDPTVIYGLGDQFQGDLTRSHLKQDTPYNSYTHQGLPPTPIALPGQASLLAAVQPAVSKALYFVAKGDGSHHFSERLDDHQAAVRQFQTKKAMTQQ